MFKPKRLKRSGNSATMAAMQAPGVVRSAQFRMANHLAGGELASIMTTLYGESHSWEQVARQLYATYGVTITGQTLRRWAEQLGIEEPAA